MTLTCSSQRQVEAVPKLALPYFLDACDEIEKLRGPTMLTPEREAEIRANYDGWNDNDARTAYDLLAEIDRLRELLEQAEVDTERKVDAELRGKLEALREAGEGLSAATQDVEGSLLAYWTDISQGEVQRLLPILRTALAAWRKAAGSGAIQADKPFPDDEVFIGYGPSGP